MQKVSYLILLCLSLLSAGLHAQTINEYVKFDINSTLAVYGVTDTTYELNSAEPSGDATSESSPVRVYVPIGGATQADNFLYRVNDLSKTYIFNVSATNNSEVIRLPMEVKTLTDDRYLYAAVKVGTEYKMLKQYSSGPLFKNELRDVFFEISPFDICRLFTITDSNNCEALVTGDTKNFMLYFFMSDSSDFVEGALASSYTKRIGSMYYEISLSSKINDSINIDIVETKKGDRRVTAFYNANTSILNPKSVRAILRNGPSANYDTISSSGGGKLHYKEFPFARESSVVINELVNDTTYTLSLVFVDKYNFSTRLSPSFDATPMAIEELLQKEACFLLTAGFGEEHYVIDYFRSIRDNVLSQFYFGRVFITTYYDLAPKYALVIYENETIRSIIRGMAYVGYFLFNNLTLILGLSIIVLSLFVKQTKKKGHLIK